MKLRLTTALLLCVTAPGCGGEGTTNQATANVAASLTQVPAPNGGDWTQVVSETPDGGFRMGNPAAPVKLVEYASITCHVCAQFSEAGSQALQAQYVRSGQVSWEYRPFMLFPSDPALFMLLRCQGATPFFGLAEQLYASQEEWSGRLQAMSPEQQQALRGQSPAAQANAIVTATGLDQFFRQRGMPAARIDACLQDRAGLERLTEITRAGSEEHGVSGTPTFLINGERQNVTAWPALEERLRMAIGG